MSYFGNSFDGLGTLIAWAGIALLSYIGYSIYTQATDYQVAELIEQCEAELPRNQRCIIVAIPEPPKEGE